MLLLIHITAAVAGLSTAAANVLTPSRRLMRLAYSLLTATLASGIGLIWYLHAPLTATCLSGLAYTAVMAVLTAAGKVRLARMKI